MRLFTVCTRNNRSVDVLLLFETFGKIPAIVKDRLQRRVHTVTLPQKTFDLRLISELWVGAWKEDRQN